MSSTKPSGQDPAPKPKRRRFTPEYKLRIVAEYDAAHAKGLPGRKTDVADAAWLCQLGECGLLKA
ncbi:hypothetical protein ACFCYB_42255, partial [Streptomyces sp. NPDC056309]|uniref:hypothetical protein n=1 Tax=unclassified Streptomyces TaxID=2593676 RepID=UPI0035DBCA42